ncbi:MAG TPA: acyl-CoA dehydrogenase, partial [Nocardioidaceae bacterium]
MSIGLTEEQSALASSLAEWAADRGFAEQVRAAEGEPSSALLARWSDLAGLGVLGIGVPESAGGAGGSLVDLACALEAAAAGMVPGPLLSTAVAAALLAEQADSAAGKRFLPGICDGSVRVGLAPSASDLRSDDGSVSGRVPVVADGGRATHLLVGSRGVGSGHETWHLVPAEAAGVGIDDASQGPDLSRTVGSVRLDGVLVESDARIDVPAGHVSDLLLVLAAAEATGVARWALGTAVEYARVREQFGRKIGSFQAIKHLCAEMLERAESATAVAWDAASAHAAGGDQLRFAARVAGAVSLDAAVENAKDCIQVLGGIGFTWEHDAHLYLRRALGTRQLLGGTDRLRVEVTDLALDGARRSPQIELGEEAETVRASIRGDVDRVASARGSDRRTALVETGLLMPHWPRPFGRGSGPREQLVIDEELTAAGVERPGLGIGAWAVPTILAHGTQAQQERFVPATLRGEIVW